MISKKQQLSYLIYLKKRMKMVLFLKLLIHFINYFLIQKFLGIKSKRILNQKMDLKVNYKIY